jgi:predicted HAD superfamily Cof-like phosphohydrolase
MPDLAPLVNEFVDVGRVHKKFGFHHVEQDGTGAGPREITEEERAALILFRIDFMQEELDEFCQAVDNADEAGMFDALIDIVYVAMGTAHYLGYPWKAGWRLVQEANMAKERGTNKRGVSYDLIKPEGWTPPDIEGLLAEYGF